MGNSMRARISFVVTWASLPYRRPGFHSTTWIAPLLLTIWIVPASRAESLSNDDKIFDIPRADGIITSEQLAHWNDPGLQVSTMCCAKGIPWPKSTAAPSMRIAWNTTGLITAVLVHHPHPWEADYVRHLFQGDSVEFFVSPQKGSRDRYMLIISPGIDPRYPQPRHCFFADPSEEGEKDLSDLAFQCARQPTDDGYTMEVLLPWSNLHVKPRLGMELALQVYVMEAEPNATPVVAMWQPAGESHIDPRSTQRIRLAEQPDVPVLTCATAQDDAEHNLRTVRIVAPASYAGKQLELRTEDTGVVYASLVARKTQSFATLSLSTGEPCRLSIDSVPIPLVVLPPADDLATIMSQKLKCKFQACIFTGEDFPRPYVEGAQHYRVSKVTYYDAAFHPVQSASVAGRYGAVIEIADAKGKLTRRFRTLFRVPDSLGPWQASSNALTTLPVLLAMDSQAAMCVPLDASGRRDLAFLKQEDALANPDTAALAACLFATQNKSLREDGLTDFRSLDRQWWVDLKRKLNGWDRQFPKPFICPVPIVGAPAPMVHVDTDAKAGIKAGGIQEIDRICQGITADVDEPISICLVRHGIVFFHKAYGQIDGRPFTVDDTGDIQSATKPLGGALMMEVIDAGLVHEQEPIDRVLPSFSGIPVKRPMIIQDLYDHLNGLTGDWGDQIHDTDEIVAGYYPVLDVGNYSYNEVGFALGGKIIEAASGQAFPQFARRHLLAPLGMDHTRVTSGGGHNATTSLDYAKFGQLLLNRGSYGNMRFFSEATFDQMLPASDGSNRRGTGLMWMNWQKFGFSPNTFGHNAGNSSVLGVDPAHDLVVVIVSAGTRKDFDSRAAPFYQAIINSLE